MTLGEYIDRLIIILRETEADSYKRLCQVVDDRKAIIGLDAERVEIQVVDGNLLIVPWSAGDTVDGVGSTDSATVIDLLDGCLEATEAIKLGRIEVCGTINEVDRMFAAIEILLDVSTRAPRMQDLSQRFRSEFSRRTQPPAPLNPSWYPFLSPQQEHAILARLDLLPD